MANNNVNKNNINTDSTANTELVPSVSSLLQLLLTNPTILQQQFQRLLRKIINLLLTFSCHQVHLQALLIHR